MEETFKSWSFSVVDLSPTDTSEKYDLTEENLREMEWNVQMRMNWRERVQIFFSNQNTDFEPLPSWFEVPTRPSDPLGIEQWERDNVMRRFWSARLNEGYTQTNITVENELSREYLEPSEISLPCNNDEDLLYESTSASEYLNLSGFTEYDKHIPEFIQTLIDGTSYNITEEVVRHIIQGVAIDTATNNDSENWEGLVEVLEADMMAEENIVNCSDIFEEEDLGFELLFSEDYHASNSSTNN
jgi:hypothetical protein